jgi:hypothetical protein
MSSLDGWVKAQTIFGVIGLAAILVASIAVIADRIERVQKKDNGRTSADRDKMMYFYVEKLGWLNIFFGRKTSPLKITTISGLIEAGDRGLFTSAALDYVQSAHLDVTWVSVFASIFEDIARQSDENTKAWSESSFISKVIARARRSYLDLKSPKCKRWALYKNEKLVNCCRELEKNSVDPESSPLPYLDSYEFAATMSTRD